MGNHITRIEELFRSHLRLFSTRFRRATSSFCIALAPFPAPFAARFRTTYPQLWISLWKTVKQ